MRNFTDQLRRLLGLQLSGAQVAGTTSYATRFQSHPTIRRLEQRRVLNADFGLSGATLTLDNFGNRESLTITGDGSEYNFELAGSSVWEGTDSSGISGDTLSVLSVKASAVETIVVNDARRGDLVTLLGNANLSGKTLQLVGVDSVTQNAATTTQLDTLKIDADGNDFDLQSLNIAGDLEVTNARDIANVRGVTKITVTGDATFIAADDITLADRNDSASQLAIAGRASFKSTNNSGDIMIGVNNLGQAVDADVQITSLIIDTGGSFDVANDGNLTDLAITVDPSGGNSYKLVSGGVTTFDVKSFGSDLSVNNIDTNAHLSIFADGDILVGTISAGTAGDVTLNATGTLDGKDDSNSLTADQLSFSATGAVGGTHAINTTVAEILSGQSTGAGDIEINETNAITLTSLTNADGAIRVVAGGTIIATNVNTTGETDTDDITLVGTQIAIGTISTEDTTNDIDTMGDVILQATATTAGTLDGANASNTLTADRLSFSATGAVGGTHAINTTVAEILSGQSTGAGDIEINETNAITLTSLTNADGAIRVVAGGTIIATNVNTTGETDTDDITLVGTQIAIGTISTEDTTNNIDTMGDVILQATATTAGTLDGANASNTLTADRLSFSATGAVGGTHAINTTVAAILSGQSTGAGDIEINETNAITLTSLTNADGAIRVVAGGTIIATNVNTTGETDTDDITLVGTQIAIGTISTEDTTNNIDTMGDVILQATATTAGTLDGANASNTLTADRLSFSATGAVGGTHAINTTVAAILSGQSTGAGDIEINETNAITLTSLTNEDGAIRVVAGGTIIATNVNTTGETDTDDITLVGTQIAIGTISTEDTTNTSDTRGDVILRATATTAGTLDGANASNTLTADQLSFSATGAVGGTHAINTTVAEILSGQSTGAGDIEINEADAITLTSLTNTHGAIQVVAEGAIIATNVNTTGETDTDDITLQGTQITIGTISTEDTTNTSDTMGDVILKATAATAGTLDGANASNSLTADQLSFSATGAVGGTHAINTTVAEILSGQSTGAGRIDINETDAITLTSLTNTSGAIQVVAGGAITATHVLAGASGFDVLLMTTAGDIAVVRVTAGRNVTIHAAEDIVDADAGADAIDIVAGANIDLEAGGDIGEVSDIFKETNLNLLEITAAGNLDASATNGSIAIDGVIGGMIRPRADQTIFFQSMNNLNVAAVTFHVANLALVSAGTLRIADNALPGFDDLRLEGQDVRGVNDTIELTADRLLFQSSNSESIRTAVKELDVIVNNSSDSDQEDLSVTNSQDLIFADLDCDPNGYAAQIGGDLHVVIAAAMGGTISDAQGVTIEVAGDASFTATQAIELNNAAGEKLTVGGTAAFDIPATADLFLGQHGAELDLNRVEIATEIRNVSIAESNGLTLQNVVVGQTLFVSAATGNIFQDIAQPGTTTISSGTTITATRAAFRAESGAIILRNTAFTDFAAQAVGSFDLTTPNLADLTSIVTETNDSTLDPDDFTGLGTVEFQNQRIVARTVSEIYGVVLVHNTEDLTIGPQIQDPAAKITRGVQGVGSATGHAYIETAVGKNLVFAANGPAVEMMGGYVFTAVAGEDLIIAPNTTLHSATGVVHDVGTTTAFDSFDGRLGASEPKRGPRMVLTEPGGLNGATSGLVGAGTEFTQRIQIDIGSPGERNFFYDTLWADQVGALSPLPPDNNIPQQSIVDNDRVAARQVDPGLSPANITDVTSRVFPATFLNPLSNPNGIVLPAEIRLFNDPSINLFDQGGQGNLNRSSSSALNSSGSALRQDNYVEARLIEVQKGIQPETSPRPIVAVTFLPPESIDTSFNILLERQEFDTGRPIVAQREQVVYGYLGEDAVLDQEDTLIWEEGTTKESFREDIMRTVRNGNLIDYPYGDYEIKIIWSQGAEPEVIRFSKLAETSEKDRLELESESEQPAVPPWPDQGAAATRGGSEWLEAWQRYAPPAPHLGTEQQVALRQLPETEGGPRIAAREPTAAPDLPAAENFARHRPASPAGAAADIAGSATPVVGVPLLAGSLVMAKYHHDPVRNRQRQAWIQQVLACRTVVRTLPPATYQQREQLRDCLRNMRDNIYTLPGRFDAQLEIATLPALASQ